MRRLRLLLPVILLCVGLGAPSRAGTSTGAKGPIELKGTTTIVGSNAGYVTVSLPKNVELPNPLISDDEIRIRGKGDFVGFALYGIGPKTSRGHIYLGGRLPESAGGRTFLDDPRNYYANNLTPEVIDIHRGVYRLYILPGEGKAEVQIKLPGLSGEVELHPTNSVAYEAEVTKPVHETPGSNYYAAGGTGTLQGPGIVFGAAWLSTTVHASTYADLCFWDGPPAEDEGGYLPLCGSTIPVSLDNGLYYKGTTVDNAAGVDRPFRLHFGSWQPHTIGFDEPGRDYGYSVILGSASAVESIGSLALWLTYK